jgi:pyruvate,orthophosphate dikinase
MRLGPGAEGRGMQAWGRYFTRNPQTGLKRASAEVFTSELQVLQPLLALQQSFPEAAAQLQQLADAQEAQERDALCIEFQVKAGRLLPGRIESLARTPQAACKIAVSLVQQGLLTPEQAVLRIEPEDLRQMLLPWVEEAPLVCRGESLAPGVATGRIVTTANGLTQAGEPLILLCDRLSYAERDALDLVAGVIVRSGPALAARHQDRPCLRAPDCQLIEGELVTLDANAGKVLSGEVGWQAGALSGDAHTLLDWADRFRKLEIRANVSWLAEAKQAPELGAQGVGLYRIEPLFQAPHRLALFQQVLRQICYEKLPASPAYQRLIEEVSQDVAGLLETTAGPFNVRLLDAPLAQMLGYWRDSGELAPDYFAGELAAWLQELNPMQGFRCGRLSLLYPKLMEIQLRAILRGAAGRSARLQVMLPGVCDAQELRIFRRRLEDLVAEEKVSMPQIGSMLEIPRACLLADQLGEVADFLSFGTGDLTEATCGISRYDAPLSFLPAYLEQSVFERDPFEAIDQAGVGALMRLACERVQAKCPSVEMGICGAQAADPRSLEFCSELGLKYVSVPIRHLAAARLVAAQTVLRRGIPRQPLPRLHRS